MKNRHRRLLAVLLGLVAILSWTSIWPEYSSNHGYYIDMISNRRHRVMLLGGIGVAVGGLARNRSITTRRKKLLLWFGVIVIFAMLQTGLKGGLSASGIFGLVWKHLWIVGIIIFHIGSLHALGSRINQKLFHLSRTTTHIILTMAIGLVANILVMYILLLVGGMYPIVVWIIFLAMGALIYLQRSSMQKDYQTLADAWSGAIEHKSRGWWIQQALLVAAIVYLLYGLQLAFIPYSTAWDANHAYMFFPKIWADHHGLYRSDGPWTSPFVRYAYISQWFSSMERLTPITGIARDTMAVIMNFVTSAVGILVVGAALFDTVARRFTKHKASATTFSLISGALLLLWLTSGMGAFLVFVDNKTDLGILLLVMVALLSAFMFLTHMDENSEQTPSSMRYAIVSGVFFGVAFLGKPTAFIDIAGFVSMVIGTQLGVLGVIGVIALVVGAMAAMQLRSTGTYLEPSAAKVALGGLLLIPAVWVEKVYKSRKWLRLLLIWGVALIVTIVIGKMPYLAQRAGDRSGSDWVRNFLLSSTSIEQSIDTHSLVAATGETDNPADEVAIQAIAADISTPSLEQCSLESLGVTMEELRDRQRDIIGGGATEDNGRYVGYGQRVLTADDAGLRYYLMKGIFPSDNGCYTSNVLAKELCQSSDQLTTGSVAILAAQLAPTYEYVADIDTKLSSGDIFPQDAVSLLTEYYQSRTISTTVDSVAIPYRWLVPANITFNRSLQNRSSYYTDIGVIRLPALIIALLGFIRGAIIRDKKIIALTGATLLVWIAWMLVADGIVWYGMGMIIWTILAATAVLTRWMESLTDNQSKGMVTWIIMIAFAILLVTQWFLNMMRISSQGAGGPFLSYKQGLGTLPAASLVDGQLSASNTLQGVGQSDILALQFAHYLPIMQALEDRQDEDGVFIAGTYLQYFLRNQSNIRSDNLVTSLRKEMSDSDVCASYLRLRDTGYRTIILDPNIATVVLGEGNQSLKERFIMKEDDQGNRIDDGVLSMMARMVMADYAELGFTNNIGLYYAYTLSSDELAPYMEAVGESDEVTFRTRLAMARFLPQEMLQQYFGVINQFFLSRFGSYDGMADLGRIYGEELGSEARTVVNTALQGQVEGAQFDALTPGQRLIVYRYAQLVNSARNPQAESQVQQQLSQILQQSISSQSQIASFNLK